jgi:hypothetical protein
VSATGAEYGRTALAFLPTTAVIQTTTLRPDSDEPSEQSSSHNTENETFAQTMKTSNTIVLAALIASLLKKHVFAFSVQRRRVQLLSTIVPSKLELFMSSSVESKTAGGFIETELRGQAMKLHTRSQAPKEGEAKEKNMEPYTPTREDYLKFLVDSQHIYKAFEDIVNELDELTNFRNTGLERVKPLEEDIEFMVKEYSLQRSEVGQPGVTYAADMRRLGTQRLVPEFMCHYYNFHFAHTAGGRMIGKQMSALLLEKKTLEFYKVGDGPASKFS